MLKVFHHLVLWAAVALCGLRPGGLFTHARTSLHPPCERGGLDSIACAEDKSQLLQVRTLVSVPSKLAVLRCR
jgi:hypothetical protein